ncbi:MAG TPA: acyl-CoA carboxylase epsilon subunit [Acidimicrobiia bacterium]|nr:acyl-CoA carboxylase epsilon subunit [Acidimicrobiia bacterium]
MRLEIVGGNPQQSDVAAIVAAFSLIETQLAAEQAARVKAAAPKRSQWVDASRRAAQRATMQRGSWRLSGRIGRRSRI